MAEVHVGGLGFEGLELAACVVVAAFEVVEGAEGRAAEAEGGGEAGPVDF